MMTDNGVCTVININANDIYSKNEGVIKVINELADYQSFTDVKMALGAGKGSALRLVLSAPQSYFKGRANEGKFKVNANMQGLRYENHILNLYLR